MPPLARSAALGIAAILTGCAAGTHDRDGGRLDPATAAPPPPSRAKDVLIASPSGTPRPPFRFSAEDDRLLDDTQQGAFWFLWRACDPATGMVVDRSSTTMASVAGVGFQLAAIPVGVERGWITKDAGRDRTRLILASLEKSPRKEGLYYHYLDGQTAQIPKGAYETVVSTIDSALLLSGLLVASSYFGEDVAARADALLAAANWSFFVDPDAKQPHWQGFVSLGWKPQAATDPTGPGTLLPFYWIDAGDEQKLVTFLAVAAPNPEHRIDPGKYYQLRRAIGEYGDSGPFSYFPWSGALFTNFFAHCFIDYAGIGPDNPGAFGEGGERRSRIDWWENSRRAVAMHQRKALENPKGVPTLGEHAWGLTASDFKGGYAVPGLYPDPVRLADARPRLDFEPNHTPKDDYGDGTIAPYGAGCSVMFEPQAAIAALRHYRNLLDKDGNPLVWRGFDPEAPTGNYGFRDAFNTGTGWVAPDYVAIDQGPLVLAIENARTGLVWELFHAHPYVRAATDRLALERRERKLPTR